MAITKKAALIALLGAILVILMIPFNWSVPIFFIYNGVFIAIFLWDYIKLPTQQQIIVSRANFDNKLLLNDQNAIKTRIKNLSERSVVVEIQDALPDFHFKGRGYAKVAVEAFSEVLINYTVVPAKRGAFTFGDIAVRAKGGLGLSKRQFVAQGTSIEFKVYPNLSLLGKYRLIVQKNLRLADGNRPVKIRGQGTEFEGITEYTPGDDYRKINWKASARLGKLALNQYGVEKNQPVYILIDAGRSMSYQVGGNAKIDYAIHAALILSDIVNQKGDQSGLMVFDSDVRTVVAPGHGGSHRNNIMEALYHIYPTKDAPDFEGVFKELVKNQKRRSLICIFTDFDTVEEAEDICRLLPLIAKKHIPLLMLMKNEEMHDYAQAKPSSIDVAFQGGVAAELLEDRRRIISILNTKGVFCVENPRENLAISAVNQYLTVKNKNML